jgi:predicted small integral membrane protein
MKRNWQAEERFLLRQMAKDVHDMAHPKKDVKKGFLTMINTAGSMLTLASFTGAIIKMIIGNM